MTILIFKGNTQMMFIKYRKFNSYKKSSRSGPRQANYILVICLFMRLWIEIFKVTLLMQLLSPEIVTLINRRFNLKQI